MYLSIPLYPSIARHTYWRTCGADYEREEIRNLKASSVWPAQNTISLILKSDWLVSGMASLARLPVTNSGSIAYSLVIICFFTRPCWTLSKIIQSWSSHVFLQSVGYS